MKAEVANDVKSNLRMTIISRNIRPHLSRECHFSKSNAERSDQCEPNHSPRSHR